MDSVTPRNCPKNSWLLSVQGASAVAQVCSGLTSTMPSTFPRAGDIEIVVDHLHAPVMVTRIVSSEIMPFNEVTAEYAAIEGEGDGSLKYWRWAHWNFFSRECKRIGKQPTESMLVICSVFEVLHVLPPPSEA